MHESYGYLDFPWTEKNEKLIQKSIFIFVPKINKSPIGLELHDSQ